MPAQTMSHHPSLRGRTVLITGGSRGIGRSFALALARAGARVAVCGRNAESLDRVLLDLRAQGALDPLAVVGDVSRRADSERIVEEVAIVGDGHHGAGVFLQEALQPGHAFGIQVVGGLVQQQHVGVGQQQAAQCHPALLTARQIVHVGIPGWQAQGVGGDLELALQIPAFCGVDGILQFALLFQQRVHLVVAHRFGEAVADGVEFLDQLQDRAHGLLDIAAHILRRVEGRFLGQVADVDAGLGAGLAMMVLVDARHDAQQRGLAGAVQAEHADLGAGEE